MVKYINSTRNITKIQKSQFIWENIRSIVSNILGVQKQSLGLGQINKQLTSTVYQQRDSSSAISKTKTFSWTLPFR